MLHAEVAIGNPLASRAIGLDETEVAVQRGVGTVVLDGHEQLESYPCLVAPAVYTAVVSRQTSLPADAVYVQEDPLGPPEVRRVRAPGRVLGGAATSKGRDTDAGKEPEERFPTAVIGFGRGFTRRRRSSSASSPAQSSC